MKILVCSCDKDVDLFLPFHHCVEKYWPDHYEIIYLTDTLDNPYYKTIKKNYPINQWTRRVREACNEISDDKILLMCGDVFLQDKVNTNEIDALLNFINDDVGSINLQVGGDYNSVIVGNNLRLMIKDAKYKTSVMCSIWNKNALLNVFKYNLDPWSFEMKNIHMNYLYYRLERPAMIWGGEYSGKLFGVFRGKWVRSTKIFLDHEGLDVDYSKRGFYD